MTLSLSCFVYLFLITIIPCFKLHDLDVVLYCVILIVMIMCEVVRIVTTVICFFFSKFCSSVRYVLRNNREVLSYV